MNHRNPPSKGPGDEPTPDIVYLPEVLKRTGLTLSALRRMVAEGTFPAPVEPHDWAVPGRCERVRRSTHGRPNAAAPSSRSSRTRH